MVEIKEVLNIYNNNELVNTIADIKAIYKALLNNLIARYLFKDKSIRVILKVDNISFYGYYHIIIEFNNNKYYEFIISR